MKTIVCIKQVPNSSNVKVDPQTGILIRDGNNTRLNPYDLFAIELALTCKRANDVISTITMGPPSANTVLAESIYMGVDQAYLLSDRAFAGADVLATARTLSQGIQYINDFDLIICGKQTTDGDTAQVGPEIAEHLHIPHVTNVTNILEIKEKSIVLNCTVDEFIIKQEVTLPCVLCTDANINTPRLPSYKIMKQRQPLPIQLITLKDLPIKDTKYYGLNASPTQILKIYSTEKNANKILHEGSTAEQAALMYRVLKDTKVV